MVRVEEVKIWREFMEGVGVAWWRGVDNRVCGGVRKDFVVMRRERRRSRRRRERMGRPYSFSVSISSALQQLERF